MKNLPLFLVAFFLLAQVAFSEDDTNGALPGTDSSRADLNSAGVPYLNSPAADLNVPAGQPEDATDSQIPDLNADAHAGGSALPPSDGEPPIDANGTPEPGPGITLVAPLGGRVVRSQTLIAIAVPTGFSGVSGQWFSLSGDDYNGTPAGETYSAPIDASKYPNGAYEITAFACGDGRCESASAMIEIDILREGIDSAELPAEALTGEGVLRRIIPSNSGGAVSITDANGSVVDSGISGVSLKDGIYNAEFVFPDGLVAGISLNGMSINSNLTLVELSYIDAGAIAAPDSSKEWLSVVAIKPNVRFASGKAVLRAPRGAEYLFQCPIWDFSSGSCISGWSPLGGDAARGDGGMPLPDSISAFALAFDTAANVSFGRRLECHKCGQHKAPPNADVSMTISAEAAARSGKTPLYFFPLLF